MTPWQVSWLGVDLKWRCSDGSLPAHGAVTGIVSAPPRRSTVAGTAPDSAPASPDSLFILSEPEVV